MGNLVNIDIDTKILCKVWDSIDKVLWNPISTITNAKANSIANKIKVKNELSIEELRITRLQALKLKKQQNLESIINQSTKFIESEDDVKDLDEDWFMYFSEKAKLSSKKDIQLMWAKLLSEELKNTNSISKRLLHLVSILNEEDCKNFETLSKFIFFVDNSPSIIIADYIKSHEEYRNFGITYNLLSSLSASGLIVQTPYLGIGLKINNKNIEFKNRNGETLFNLISLNCELHINNITLTPVGEELWNALNFNPDFPIEFIKEKLIYLNPNLKTENTKK